MTENYDFFEVDHTIDTPENVAFDYALAGIGNRFVAAVIDTLIIFVVEVGGFLAMWLLSFGLSPLEDEIGWLPGLILAMMILLQFSILYGYYVIAEMHTNGQSPGKRYTKIRVVRVDGNPVGWYEVLIRNLVRLVDFLPGFYGLGLLTMFFNDQSRRLGDFAAGTIVIKDQGNSSLQAMRMTLATPNRTIDEESRSALLAKFPAANRLGDEDVLLIRDVLDRDQGGLVSDEILNRLIAGVVRKMRIADPRSGTNMMRMGKINWLRQVAEAYRYHQS